MQDPHPLFGDLPDSFEERLRGAPLRRDDHSSTSSSTLIPTRGIGRPSTFLVGIGLVLAILAPSLEFIDIHLRRGFRSYVEGGFSCGIWRGDYWSPVGFIIGLIVVVTFGYSRIRKLSWRLMPHVMVGCPFFFYWLIIVFSNPFSKYELATYLGITGGFTLLLGVSLQLISERSVRRGQDVIPQEGREFRRS